MVQNFLRGQPLGRFPPQDASDEALGLGRQSLWNVELATSDLAEEGTGLNVMERVPPYQHGVQHHSQAPHVSGFARVAAAGVQDLRAHISRAAMLVGEGVIISPQDVGIFQAFQLDPSPARKGAKHELRNIRIPSLYHSSCRVSSDSHSFSQANFTY